MIFRSPILFAFSLLVCAAALPALNLWRHPEIADKNALFADAGASILFKGLKLPILPVELRLDYLPPLPLPISIGVFFKTPYPNLRSFGTRAAYHFDLDDPKTDLYFVHVFDCGFIRNDILEEYNDDPVQIHRYDFRVGVRRFFGPFIGLVVESEFKARGIIILLSAKLH